MLHGGGDSEGHGVDHYGVELQELLIQPETQPNCNNRVIWHWDDEMDSYKYSGLPENSEISRRTTDALMERFFNELKQKPNYGLRKMNEFVNTTLMIISALWLICIIYEYFCFCCKLYTFQFPLFSWEMGTFFSLSTYFLTIFRPKKI